MNKNEKFVITINRELGSGGRTVGRKLAEKLGVEFYDKALIKALTEKYHLSVEEVEKLKGRSHSWWADFKRVARIGDGWGVSGSKFYQVKNGEEPDLLTTDDMFKTEVEILKGITEEESCVIAGRSGFFVFRAHPHHLSLLIKASMPSSSFRVHSSFVMYSSIYLSPKIAFNLILKIGYLIISIFTKQLTLYHPMG